MELQEYLRAHGLEKLAETYSIKATKHQQYPHLVCLKYSQLDSPMGEKIVQQCRGIIFDQSHNWQLVSYPYDKFFNHGEGHAATVDWSSARVYDKLDGSLMTLYFYDGQWRVQSSGTPDGAGEVSGFGMSFAQLFWSVWTERGYQLPEATDCCFMFELMTKYNRVVVVQPTNQLVLHGVRHLQTLTELDPQPWSEQYGWQLVARHPLTSWPAVIAAAQLLDPMNLEGYIVCDRQFNRVKVKSPQYVAIAHLRSSFSARRMLEIIMANEGEEFLAYFPEWTEIYQKIKHRYHELIQEITDAYQQYQGIAVQKDFAAAIQHLPYTGVLFSLRSGKVQSVRECLQAITIYKMEQLLGVDYIDLGM
jgi:RNA ligase